MEGPGGFVSLGRGLKCAGRTGGSRLRQQRRRLAGYHRGSLSTQGRAESRNHRQTGLLAEGSRWPCRLHKPSDGGQQFTGALRHLTPGQTLPLREGKVENH